MVVAQKQSEFVMSIQFSFLGRKVKLKVKLSFTLFH